MSQVLRSRGRSLSLIADLVNLAHGRQFICDAAQDAGFPEDRIFDIILASSEAMSNAIEHAKTYGEIVVETRDYPDRFEVSILGNGEFEIPSHSNGERRGLGLPIMAKMSDHLALYSALQGGTLVGLTFYRDAPAQPPPDSPLPPSLIELVESSGRLESLINAVPGVFSIVDAHGRWIYTSRSGARRPGQPAGGLIGHTLSEDQELVDSGLPALLEEVKRQRTILRRELYNRADGTWTEVAAFPFADGAAYFSLPITERKRAEQALKESEERYRVLARENERLYKEQLEVVENLQRALLCIPPELGPLRLGHLYRSATETARIGGDFYDVFPMKHGKVALLIGDVAGHGIEGARVASLTRDVIHAFAHQSVKPQNILRQANGLLMEKAMPGFVTLFLGILDIDSFEMHYAAAGHPETLLRRSSGEVELLGGSSPPLGAYQHANWTPGRTRLEPGDLLLLYTDGVIEARRNGSLFGEERLRSLLRKRVSVGRLPALILDRVLAFSDGTLQDDVAILTVLLTGQGQTAKAAGVELAAATPLA